MKVKGLERPNSIGFYKIKLCFLQFYICNLPSTSFLHSCISFICVSRFVSRQSSSVEPHGQGIGTELEAHVGRHSGKELAHSSAAGAKESFTRERVSRYRRSFSFSILSNRSSIRLSMFIVPARPSTKSLIWSINPSLIM